MSQWRVKSCASALDLLQHLGGSPPLDYEIVLAARAELKRPVKFVKLLRLLINYNILREKSKK